MSCYLLITDYHQLL